ncbi:hypothetical protein BDZ97DRAFT_2059898 [Flammula alnicola]|nr:hypothetical protein BDZ97DRAFT_2059898 [Flammula alnicola]
MNVPVKSKRKTHTDPYAGGEKSGKKARTDALHPYVAPTVQSVLAPPAVLPAPLLVVSAPPPPVPTPTTLISTPPAPTTFFSTQIPLALIHPLPNVSVPTSNLPSNLSAFPVSAYLPKENVPPISFVPVPARTGTVSAASSSSKRKPQTMPMQPGDDGFNPAAIDIRDKLVLQRLKRQHLNKVCKLYNVPAKGTNEDLIDHLQKLAAKT